MKRASLAALVALAAVASAQQACIPVALSVNPCATSCLTSAGSAQGCNFTDFACQCSKADVIAGAASGCVISACGINTALAVQSQAADICSCVSSQGGGGAPKTSATATAGGGGGGSSKTDAGAAPATSAAPAPVSSASASAAGAGAGGSSMTSTAGLFTAGAAYTVGSIGGVFGAVLAVIAAL